MPGRSETRAAVAHLVRRLGFGAPADEIDDLASGGYAEAVERVCVLDEADATADAIPPPTFDTAGYLASRDGDEATRREAERVAAAERRALPLWWGRRMVAAQHPAREKLTFLWHEHFATSLEKVQIAEALHLQWQTLHALGAGRFDELVHAVARDPAMLIWLDGRESTGVDPNENFARELLELFTLGHPGHGDPDYTERDVSEAARALTGWRIDVANGVGVLDPRRHDRGSKVVLGRRGDLGLDDVVAACVEHPACAPHVVGRLWSRLARPTERDDPVVLDLAGQFRRDLDVSALIKRICLHPEFQSDATRVALVRAPVDLVAGTLRALRVPAEAATLAAVVGLGQIPFFPPDVAGWPAGEAWLSTSAARVRIDWALAVAARADLDGLDIATGDPARLARVLGVEGWSDATASVLDAVANPQQALALAIVAPEHLVA